MILLSSMQETDPSHHPSVIFVYNADSGLISTVKDYFHKIVKPSTYQCNLCALTFDNLGMKNGWKSFVDDLEPEIVFLHKDEFLEKFNMKDAKFPSAFVKSGSKLSLLISQAEIDNTKSLDELIKLVTDKVNEIKQ